MNKLTIPSSDDESDTLRLRVHSSFRQAPNECSLHLDRLGPFLEVIVSFVNFSLPKEPMSSVKVFDQNFSSIRTLRGFNSATIVSKGARLKSYMFIEEAQKYAEREGRFHLQRPEHHRKLVHSLATHTHHFLS